MTINKSMVIRVFLIFKLSATVAMMKTIEIIDVVMIMMV
jgi:hypothetical protein